MASLGEKINDLGAQEKNVPRYFGGMCFVLQS